MTSIPVPYPQTPEIQQGICKLSGTSIVLVLFPPGSFTVQEDGGPTTSDIRTFNIGRDLDMAVSGNTVTISLEPPSVDVVSSAYTASSVQFLIGDTTGAAFTITLPAANASPPRFPFYISKRGPVAKLLTISPAVGDTINRGGARTLRVSGTSLILGADLISDWRIF